MTDQNHSYPVDGTNRVKRRHDRGFYDHETVHKLYWHGSSASRMLRNLSEGEPACVTVTHLDSLVLARSGFNHSADYRSVMAFGQARLVEDPEEKLRALTMMVDRFFPERTASLRPATTQEIKATTVIVMEIDRASAKVRAKGIADDEEDYELPIYSELLPVRMVMGAPEACARMPGGVNRPETLAPYQEGRLLEEALTEAYGMAYGAAAGA